MGTLLIILFLFLVILAVTDGTSIAVFGRPVNHEKWEPILQKHFDEGNYVLFSSDNLLSTSKKYYFKVLDGECKDIPYISLSGSGILVGGYIEDHGTIYRFSKLHKMVVAEMKKQKLAKYEL
jgi:hypothetical protein